MKHIFLLIVLTIALPVCCYAGSDLDGDWKVRNKTCVSTMGLSPTCSTTNGNITITDGTVYSGETEVGSVALKGNNVVFKFESSYLEEQLKNYGYAMTIVNSNFSYKGTLKNSNQIKGKISGSVTVAYQGNSIALKFTGDFTAKKSSQRQVFYKNFDIMSQIREGLASIAR